MRTIVRQTSVGVIKQALKIEQRSDVRIRLTVVVTEQAFIVTSQAGEHVRTDELPVIGEALGRGDFKRAIETLRASETTRQTAGSRVAFASGALGRARLVAARIEDKVGVAVIERAVFYDVPFVAINPAEAQRQILGNFVLNTHGVFTDAGWLETWIKRCRIRAQVHRSEARGDGSGRRCRVTINVEVLVGLAVAAGRANVHVKRDW